MTTSYSKKQTRRRKSIANQPIVRTVDNLDDVDQCYLTGWR